MLTQNREKFQEVLSVAENLFRQSPDWVTFFRRILGVDGMMRSRFPALDQLTEFEQSEEYDKIQRMLVKLREKRTEIDEDEEPTKVITVRLPKSMHDCLRTEAHDLRTSMNKLCISKLLQMIDETMVPNERPASGSGSSRTAKAAASKDQSATTNHAPSIDQKVADRRSVDAADVDGDDVDGDDVDGDGAMDGMSARSSTLSSQSPQPQAPNSSMIPPPFKPSQPRF